MATKLKHVIIGVGMDIFHQPSAALWIGPALNHDDLMATSSWGHA